MIFYFLRYLQPSSYFSLKIRNASGYTTVFPKYSSAEDYFVKSLITDNEYSSSLAKEYDLSWRMLHTGYSKSTETYDIIHPLPLVDNYRFIRKNFNRAWVWYVFIIRIFSLKNTVKEIKAFNATKNIGRVNLLDDCRNDSSFRYFKSKLLQTKPKVSVIIPTLGRYKYLKDVLHDLEKQDFKNFDVIVIDQTDPFDPDFYTQFNLDLHVEYQQEKALWLARNKAIKMSDANYFLLFDDDSRVGSKWISMHLEALDFYEADISSGVSISTIGADVPNHYKCYKVSDQLDTGNVLIKREVFDKIGLFDRQFEKQRMGDGEFGLRAFLAGFLNISNPKAKRIHLKVGHGGLRAMGSWDAFRPTSLFSPRPIPSVLYLYRTYYSNRAVKLNLLRTLPLSMIPYRFKSNKVMLIIGAIISLLLMPFLFYQVHRSWALASEKLREGPKIDYLSNV